MKLTKDDLSLINSTETDILFNVKLNNIDCGLINITTNDNLERSAIILTNYIKNSEFDFLFIPSIQPYFFLVSFGSKGL